MDFSAGSSSDPKENLAVESSTVLVVDDDAEIVDLLQTALAGAGYNVLAGIGSEALRIADDVHPDLILMDLMMPDMDGVEMSTRLRANPGTADIPIIAMSAHDFPPAAWSRTLVNDKLPKPFRLRDLYAMVKHWCGDTAGRQAAP